MNSKKNKKSSFARLPSLFTETLIKSENEYRREIRLKLDRIENCNREAVRRRHAYDHYFAHEHLSKRYQWFQADKSFRETCRTTWDRDAARKAHTNHKRLPDIMPRGKPHPTKETFEIQEDDNSLVSNEKIKQKFLHTQPVMLEILSAPHACKAFLARHEVDLRKMSAQRRQNMIQTNAIDDPRYRQLVLELKDY